MKIDRQKPNSTVGHLMSLHHGMQALNGTAVGYLMRNRIAEFYSNNGIRIQTNGEKANAILVKYFEMDENKTIKVDENKKRILKSGLSEESYMEEWTTLMNEQIIIK